MKYGPVERAGGALLTFFAALGPAWADAPAAAPSAPVVHAAPQATLPLNDVLRGEWDISLGALADGSGYEPRIPYKDVYPSWAAGPPAHYAANLKHNEDPRNGVTVSAVLTDPAGGQHTYPCWYGEDFSAGGLPTGYAGWHLAYPCKTAGAWAGHLHVTDAGGGADGPAFSFTVAGQLTLPDAAKGRLAVAPDTRYLRYDDGDAYLPLGESAGSPAQFASRLAAAGAAHARLLLRTWQSRFGGCYGLAGGPDYDDQQGPATGLDGEDAHTGRFSYKVTSGLGGNLDGNAANTHFALPVAAGAAVNYSVWARAVGGATGTVGMAAYGSQSPDSHSADAAGADLHDGAWHRVQGTLAVPAPGQGVSLVVGGNTSAGGYWLFDDLCVTDAAHDPSAGPGSAWDVLGGTGTYELQNILDRPAAAGLDRQIQQCRATDANLLIEFFSVTDKVQGDVTPAGTLVNPLVNVSGTNTGNQMGGYASGPASAADDGAETAVGLFHAQQARAWVAQLGCYVGQGVAYLAYANEINTSGDDSGPDHWAVQLRSQCSPTSDCLPLCGVDHSFNSGGPQWTPPQYESPWLQFAEPHLSTGGSGIGGSDKVTLPFGEDAGNPFLVPGVTRHASGGPFGMGYLQIAQGTSVPNYAPFHLPTLRNTTGQAATWTLSFYAQTVPDAQGRPFSGPARPGYWSACAAVELNGNNDPGLTQPNGDGPDHGLAQVPPGGFATWQKVTAALMLAPGAVVHPTLNFDNFQPSGDVRYADITLTDPAGRVHCRMTFDEPLLDAGAGDAVATLLDTMGYSWSGEPAAGRPVVIGESEGYGAAFNTTNGVTTNSLAYPMNQYALRAAAAMLDPRWHADTLWSEDSSVMDAGGYAKFFHTTQSLLDGFFAPDGSWRGAATAQSGFTGPGEPFVVYGQANSRDAVTGAVVPATRALLSVLPLQPDPATPHAFLPGTGLVDLQGLSDAAYTVQEYDAAGGQLLATLTASSAGGHLPLNFNGVASGVIVKIGPASAPDLTLRLTVDHATAKPGDVVTYTLTYTNVGAGPALGVTVPWAVPAHMQFLSASGGTYDAASNVVNWSLGALAPGASGSVTLKARVQ